MLANGATLGVKTAPGASSYTDLPGLKEIPEMGADAEKVENTVLTDDTKKYELGIGDPGDMAYKFKFDNTGANTAYRILRGLEATGKAYDFQEKLKDGTTTTFSAQPTVKRGGGGVNAALEFTLNLALQSKLTITDPA